MIVNNKGRTPFLRLLGYSTAITSDGVSFSEKLAVFWYNKSCYQLEQKARDMRSFWHCFQLLWVQGLMMWKATGKLWRKLRLFDFMKFVKSFCSINEVCHSWNLSKAFLCFSLCIKLAKSRPIAFLCFLSFTKFFKCFSVLFVMHKVRQKLFLLFVIHEVYQKLFCTFCHLRSF